MRLVRPVLFTREKSYERTALFGDVIANGAAESWVARFEGIENRAQRHRRCDLDRDFAAHLRERPQMRWKHHSNHLSVCTSIESTAGRSRTMGDQ